MLYVLTLECLYVVSMASMLFLTCLHVIICICHMCYYVCPDRLRVDDNTEPRVSVQGFADYSDVVAQDLVPWTPLKTSRSNTCVVLTVKYIMYITYVL